DRGSTHSPWSAEPGLRFDGPPRTVKTAKNRCSCFAEPLMAVSAAPGRPPQVLWAISRSCCRSSVVEHPLGKGEVVSSILTGSTTPPIESEGRRNAIKTPAWHRLPEYLHSR